MPGQRRRRTSAMNAVLRYLEGDPDHTVAFSDQESDDEDKNVAESQTWHCHNCPLVLTEKSEIRITAPCGHIFCVHCTIQMSKCAVNSCQKRVEEVITPKIEEGEPVDEEEEAEKQRLERLTLRQKLRDCNDRINDLKSKRRSFEKNNRSQSMVEEQKLSKEMARNQAIKEQFEKQQTYLKIAKFLSTVENTQHPFPVKDNGKNEAKWYYLTAALLFNKNLGTPNKDIEEQTTSKEYKLSNLAKEKNVLEAAISEFKSKPREPWHEDEMWKELENLVSNSHQKQQTF